MFLVSVLNAVGLVLSPFTNKTKYTKQITNFKEFYNGEKPENGEVFNPIFPNPIPKPIETPNKPVITPKPAKPNNKNPVIDHKKENEEKIKSITAKFIVDIQSAKSYKESILNKINDVASRVDQKYISTLEKLKIMDYPVDYSLNGCNIKYGECLTTKEGFSIDFQKPTVINSIVFAPSVNKTCSCKRFTVTAISEKVGMSFNVNFDIGAPKLQEKNLDLPLFCTKLIISNIETVGNSNNVCLPFFCVFGPGEISNK